MAYKHGIFTSEVATSLVPPTQTDAGLIVAWGTAPVHLAATPEKPNVPVLCYDYSEFVSKFGWSDDFSAFTLCEAASSQFVLFNMSPIVFINVLDPAKHYKAFDGVVLEVITSAPVKFDRPVLLDTLKVSANGEQLIALVKDTDYIIDEGNKVASLENNPLSGDIIITYNSESETKTARISADTLPYELPEFAEIIDVSRVEPIKSVLVVNEDYSAEYDGDGNLIFTLLNDEKVIDDKVELTFHEIDPEQVTTADIIGGIDNVTGQLRGLELIEEIFPRFGLVPGTLIAPKFSTDQTVAAVMKAKCTGINSVFNAIALVDIPTDEVENYTLASEWKSQNNILDTSVICCYPKVSLGGVQYHLSTQLASLLNKVDASYDDLPYKSPSNENLQCDSAVLENGDERYLSLTQANYLNGKGITTALNFVGGWKFWGNRTSLYDASTDPKDTFIPVRRMMNWIANTLVTTFWSKIDDPLNKRLIESVINSANIWFNGLTARGAILGGRVELLATDNTTLDLMDGIIRFHVFVTPCVPARNINFIMEYDPSYIASLID